LIERAQLEYECHGRRCQSVIRIGLNNNVPGKRAAPSLLVNGTISVVANELLKANS
jgi:hypothetical protein